MWRYVIGMAFMSLVSIKGIETYMDVREDLHSGSSQQNAGYSNSALQNDVAQEEDTYSYNGRKTRIKMDNRGHFVTTAKMNGRRVEVLVDTGATSVAINKSTAKRLGIHLVASDFKYTVSTANGNTKAAAAVIERIDIGRVTVKNVRAAVLQDKALDGTLLGMTFLGALRSFEVKNRELVLVQ